MQEKNKTDTAESFEEKAGRPWLKYIIAFAAVSVVSVLLMWYYGLFSGERHPTATVLRILADSFFISGALTLCIGALVFVSRHGAFDALVYSVKYVFTLHYNHKQGIKNETFYEYKQRKSEGTKTPCLFLILIGLLFVLVAGLFSALFSHY